MQLMIAALNPLALQWGPLTVHWYGVIIAAGVLVALTLSIREGKRLGIPEEAFYDYLLIALPVAIVCARIYYVAFQWPYYAAHPEEIIAIWDGGIAIYGALIGGVVTMVLFCRSRQISLASLLDVVAPAVILAQGIGRWGNFMNQEAFGSVTTRAALVAQHLPTWLINQMLIGGHYRVPTFLYESLGDLAGFGFLMLIRHRPHLLKRGEVFLAYLIWYTAVRLVVEGMRTDSLMLGNLRVSQWLSGVLLIGAVVAWVWRRRHDPGLPWYKELIRRERTSSHD